MLTKTEKEIEYREVEKLVIQEKIVPKEVVKEKIVYKENKEITREYQEVIKVLRHRVHEMEKEVSRWQEKCSILRCEINILKKAGKCKYKMLENTITKVDKKTSYIHILLAKITGLRAELTVAYNTIEKLKMELTIINIE